MKNLDWKDSLKALCETQPELKVAAEEEFEESSAPERKVVKRWTKLSYFTEKKGRKGKTATIIAGFECSDDELREILRKLQQELGTGGSARGGEILLQGDWADKARTILEGMRERI